MENNNILSVFVDESGRFQYPDPDSRFYILSMVFHDQRANIHNLIQQLDSNIEDLGLDSKSFVFHAGPLIRKEKGYTYLSRQLRARVFNRMMSFARRLDFRYGCLCVDKKFVGSSLQIAVSLRKQLEDFILRHRSFLASLGDVKVYYDCGQSPITNLLHQSFNGIGCRVEFAQGVRPCNYKLFQLADLLCTIHLAEAKYKNGEPLTESEFRFFGGYRAFKKSILHPLKSKLLI